MEKSNDSTLAAFREFAEATSDLLSHMRPVKNPDAARLAVAKRRALASVDLCRAIYPILPPGSPHTADIGRGAPRSDKSLSPPTAPEIRQNGVVWRDVEPYGVSEAWFGKQRIGSIIPFGASTYKATCIFWKETARISTAAEGRRYIEASWADFLTQAGLRPDSYGQEGSGGSSTARIPAPAPGASTDDKVNITYQTVRRAPAPVPVERGKTLHSLARAVIDARNAWNADTPRGEAIIELAADQLADFLCNMDAGEVLALFEPGLAALEQETK